jgi:hypothetical protein
MIEHRTNWERVKEKLLAKGFSESDCMRIYLAITAVSNEKGVITLPL